MGSEVEKVNWARERSFQKVLGVLNGIRGTEYKTEEELVENSELLLQKDLSDLWKKGFANKKRILENLVPFLKENSLTFSEPTTRGIIFVEYDHIMLSILLEEDDQYDVQLYKGTIPFTRQVSCKRLGYTPNKKLNLEDLKKELLHMKIEKLEIVNRK